MDRILRGALIVTMNPKGEVFRGEVAVSGDRIAFVGHLPPAEGVEEIDARGKVLLPGFVQTHVHLCQTLFRNSADDLPLLPWLSSRMWPLEAAHSPRTLRASALLGLAELIAGGTTTLLDMGTVRHTEELFRAAEQVGIRYIGGKCLMDRGPDSLREETGAALRETEALLEQWHGKTEGRLSYAPAPRFALSCSERLLRESTALARANGLLLHTHASESRDEVEQVRAETGMDNVHYLKALGCLGPRTCLAHCVHLAEGEISLLGDEGVKVLHCPSSNLKLGSGMAPIVEMRERGITVSLGSDGAACNNNLSMFQEMRLAGLIQKARLGAGVLPAETLARMATVEGARALGLDSELGSIEAGKLADLLLLDLRKVHSFGGDLYASIVYAASPQNVSSVFVGGKCLFEDGRFLTLNTRALLRECEKAAELLG